MTGKSNRDRRAFITGAAGFIGSRVSYYLVQQGWKVVPVAADIRSAEAVKESLAEAADQDVVVHAAAVANVDRCEENPGETAAVNVAGTRHVAETAQQAGARLIFFSSEYVFDGRSGPYREARTPNPINEYGRQKLAAEQLIDKLCSNYLTIRLTTVFGSETAGKNFLMSFISRMQTGGTVRVPKDQISTPTYVEDVARITANVAGRSTVQGILNIAGPSQMSRADFAAAIAAAWHLDPLAMQSVATADLKQSARRPLKGGLIIDRLQSLGYTTTDVTAAFRQIKARAGHKEVSRAVLRPVSP